MNSLKIENTISAESLKTYVFDSHPLLKLFQKEPGHEKISRLLKKKSRRLLHIINFGEIIYLVKKRYGNAEKMRVIAAVHELGLEIVPATDAMVYEAAELKGTYSLSFGDCFALATAIQYRATLLTGDPEFHSVKKLAKIKWV